MMSNTDQNNEPIVIQPAITSSPTSPSVSQNVSRKVSINSDKGLDNPAYEHHYHHASTPRRKISTNTSDHSEIGPVRRKSILHNAVHDGHVDKYNGTRPPQINVESPNGNINNNNESSSKSWLYGFCMQCRNKKDVDGDAWEPPGWQVVCPFPYCPPYRQVARVLSIVLIGK